MPSISFLLVYCTGYWGYCADHNKNRSTRSLRRAREEARTPAKKIEIELHFVLKLPVWLQAVYWCCECRFVVVTKEVAESTRDAAAAAIFYLQVTKS